MSNPTAAILRTAEAAYQTAFARYDKARERRNQAIRCAATDGMTKAQIARETGLTRSRVGQITQPKDDPK